MKRRQLLQRGVAATTLPGLANTISAKPTGKLPMVLTRGHFETELTYEGRRFTGQKVVLKDGHTKTGYDTNGSVPGIDRGCVQDLTVVIHGLDVPASGAIRKVQEYKRSLQGAGYKGTVIGYSWDSDIAGKLGFGLAEDCADKNAPKLARFLTEYRRACPNGVLRLVSHSLGARVIMETLKVLEANKSGIKVDSVHMLGAAIDNEAPTRPASHRAFANRVGHTFNYWNSDDDVLSVVYPGWPLGESGVEGGTPPKNYTDIKVDQAVGSDHNGYMAVAAWVVNDMYKTRKPDDGSAGGGGDGGDRGNDGDGGGRFSKGDQVESTADLNTRSAPGTDSSVQATVPSGTTGTITGGPTEKGGYTWWKVNWTDRGVEGWSAGKYLKPSDSSGGGGNVSDEADAWKPAATSNYTNASRGAGKINWIVLHVTEGSYEGSISWFQNPSANVSAHYVLRNADGHATQMVRHEDIAWHAGGQNYNEYSIGIEHEGHVGQTNFTGALYQKSAAIVRRLCEQYDIPKRHPGSAVAPCDAAAGGGIIGHHQVPEANCGPNDHTDPGSTWDWEQFMALVRGDGGGGNGNDGGDDGNGGRFSAGDRVASTTNLNTRARPGTDAAIRETVSPGTTGTITGGPTQEGGYTWWKLQWETGVEGWSAGRYLTPGTGGGSGSFSDGDRVTSTTNLNTRHRPGLDSRVLKTMSPGAVGEIMNGPVRKDGYTWWGVHWLEDDLWGWSAGRYLKK